MRFEPRGRPKKVQEVAEVEETPHLRLLVTTPGWIHMNSPDSYVSPRFSQRKSN
eukprot:SAG22_NODE_6015_length_915_cov_2.412990_1_plen_53_part_01